MGLTYGWIPLAWVGGAVAVVALVRWARRSRPATGRPLAHVAALAELPRYRVLRRRRRVFGALLGLVLATTLAAGAVLAARPTHSRTVENGQKNRDIMLCLDVSGSMADLDVSLLKTFDALAGQLRGQRIGLTIFNSSAVLKIPLTTDYGFVHQGLLAAEHGVGPLTPDYYGGTQVGIADNGHNASAIGDGIASCVQNFDQRDRERARSIVLATDGEPGPGGIYSIAEGGQQAAKAKVHIYCLDRVTSPDDDIDFDPDGNAQLHRAVAASHGRLYSAADSRAVPGIVTGIVHQQATKLTLPPRRVQQDDPDTFALTALAGVLALLGLAGWIER